MQDKIYTPLSVNLRVIESKALASQIEQELLIPDPITSQQERNVNENSAGDDSRRSDEHDTKGRKKTK